ncbi:DUF4282 domain-containing protein [Occultella gossypii]|uniref:DUF4282 domain-containing protein n=1 Tax=Occultella gossypii TaxID=2800820 RepID=A0ABS7SDJ7_9MICO|nr:DUF4282 domain-containing protein [Occultella gossypii]MBZ2198420.1 DUF4282 domain-containing protein [Occultella gossypii]
MTQQPPSGYEQPDQEPEARSGPGGQQSPQGSAAGGQEQPYGQQPPQAPAGGGQEQRYGQQPPYGQPAPSGQAGQQFPPTPPAAPGGQAGAYGQGQGYGQGQAYGQTQAAAQWGAPQQRDPGFFASLFDLSFSHYITLRFAKVLFILAIIFVALGWLGAVVSAFNFDPYGGFYDDDGGAGAVLGVLTLLFGWIPGFITLLLVRVGLEFAVATIKTAQNTSKLADRS